MDRRRLLAMALLALLVAAVFGSVREFGFIEEYDDREYVLDNPQVRSGLSLDGAAWALTSVGYASNWHPLTWLSHMLDVELFGLDARGHHLTSVLLHAANAALLCLVLHAMTGALAPSAFVAALFAVHPLHVESVAWIAERKDVLSTLFGMLALGAWLRHVRRPGAGRYAAVCLALALGLLSKPMLVTLPLVLLLLDFWPLGRLRLDAGRPAAALGRLTLEKLPLLALAAAAATITILAQRRGGALPDLAGLPLADRVGNALTAYGAYLRSTLWPAGLSVFYPASPAPLAAPTTVAAALGLAGCTALALRRSRTAPWLATGWLWYLVTLLPVIGLVQVGDQAFADRYTYVPLVGIFIGAAWAAAALRRRPGVPGAALAATGVAVVAALSLAATRQVQHWRDGVTLFTRAVAVDPGAWIAHNNLGVALRARGRPQEAHEHFARAVLARPQYPDARYNLGLTLAERGEEELAAASFREAIRLMPQLPEAHRDLGALLLKRGELAEAVGHLEEAVRLNAADTGARISLEIARRQLRLRSRASGR